MYNKYTIHTYSYNTIPTTNPIISILISLFCVLLVLSFYLKVLKSGYIETHRHTNEFNGHIKQCEIDCVHICIEKQQQQSEKRTHPQSICIRSMEMKNTTFIARVPFVWRKQNNFKHKCMDCNIKIRNNVIQECALRHLYSPLKIR